MSNNRKHGRIHVVEKEREHNEHIYNQIQKKIINFSCSRLLLYNLLASMGAKNRWQTQDLGFKPCYLHLNVHFSCV
jgi:hypothetical protein